MNERIRELAKNILTNQKEFFVGDPKDWGYFFSEEELTQFTQLVIEECASIVEEASGYRLPASTYADLVRKFEPLKESDYTVRIG